MYVNDQCVDRSIMDTCEAVNGDRESALGSSCVFLYDGRKKMQVDERIFFEVPEGKVREGKVMGAC